jgi:hypothetical protein
MALGDANSVLHKEDRASAKLHSFDKHRDSVAQVLSQNGFHDCHVLRCGNAPHYTFHRGRQASRIDTIWVNEHLLATMTVGDLRSAVALRPGPLRTDHTCAMASIPFPVDFTRKPPRVIAISLTSTRPRRCNHFSTAKAERFRNKLEVRGEYDHATAKFLAAKPTKWEQLARVITLLGLDSLLLSPLAIVTAEESCLALLQDQGTTRGQNIQNEYKQQTISASHLLQTTLRGRSSLDFTRKRLHGHVFPPAC